MNPSYTTPAHAYEWQWTHYTQHQHMHMSDSEPIIHNTNTCIWVTMNPLYTTPAHAYEWQWTHYTQHQHIWVTMNPLYTTPAHMSDNEPIIHNTSTYESVLPSCYRRRRLIEWRGFLAGCFSSWKTCLRFETCIMATATQLSAKNAHWILLLDKCQQALRPGYDE